MDANQYRHTLVAVADALDAAYGVARPKGDSDIASVLVRTILSQNTTDTSSLQAFDNLKKRFPTWEAVRDAAPKDVQREIRVGGLAAAKTGYIQGALRTATRSDGSVDFSFLQDLPPAQAQAWLQGLDGVGPKTAALVLSFSLETPSFAVDTHVFRIAGRLGFYDPARMTPEKAQQLLDTHCPPERKVSTHINLIRLGREICAPGDWPRCPICPLQKICTGYRRVFKGKFRNNPAQAQRFRKEGPSKLGTSTVHGLWTQPDEKPATPG